MEWDGEPCVKVDLDRIENLADQLKRMNLNMEDGVSGLVRDLRDMIERVRRSYSEFNDVQSAINETERLLEEIFSSSRHVSEQLHLKETSLRNTSIHSICRNRANDGLHAETNS
ncbi:hypothetical protein [Fontibacillus sp. BL9]|uniref:hypothetical protein n=1 Tax=Fontibacillus sp. BL9 TaxID=3389971 RepID=UPI00397AA4B9